ncbi:MAG: diguanylate cyclase [Clostridia bacterium]
MISALLSTGVMIFTFYTSAAGFSIVFVIAGGICYFIVGGIISIYIKALDRKQAEITLQKKSFEVLFNNSTDAIIFYDSHKKIIDTNSTFSKLFGLNLPQIIGQDIDNVMDMGKNESANSLVWKELLQSTASITELVCYHKEGYPIEVLLKIIPLAMNEVLVGGYAIFSDITKQKQYESKLKYLSYHDQLTGLYNRTFFEEELALLSNREKFPISFIVSDLNGLKLINDTLGHEKGDDLIKLTAQILNHNDSDHCMVIRTGGDEFCIILPETDENECGVFVSKIRERINAYNEVHKDLLLSLSIGMATAPDSHSSLADTIKLADDLMYREKLHESSNIKGQLIDTLMATLAERDYITEGHAQRLTELGIKLGSAADISPQQLDDLTLLAQVHDLGKVGIPDHILLKEGPLTDEEWAIMKLHPEKGYRIALSSPELAGIAELILKHHEKWDGSGYPLGLKEEGIPLECRILSIIDAFDAMTSHRPYRTAITVKEALAEIERCSGSQFDPKIVPLFVEIVSTECRATSMECN